jgi:deoxyribonuclease I
MPHVLATFSLVLLRWSRALTVSADQVRIANYDAARDLFWHQLYPNGGTTLSCGEPFARQHTTVNIEHVYAASWMTQFLGCGSRQHCRRTSGRFNHMEAEASITASATWAR